jgi:hypothetical protein
LRTSSNHRPVVLTIRNFPKQRSHTTRDFCGTSMVSTVSSLRELCMVNGVEKDSFRIGKMKCGLASCADLALGTANFGAPRRRTNHASPTAAPPKPAEATPRFSSSRNGIDNSQAWRYCCGQKKKGGLNFLYIRVSTIGTNRNRNSLFPGVGSDHHYAWFDNYFVDRLAPAPHPEDRGCWNRRCSP